jgi:hypothetical protein
MHAQTHVTRKRTQAPSQQMRGVAVLCAAAAVRRPSSVLAGSVYPAPRRSGRVEAMYPCSGTWCGNLDSDFGNPMGGGPA